MSEEENDENFDDEEEAEELLKEDEAQLKALAIKARAGRIPADNLQVAIKAKDLADLYYEALEKFSDDFYRLKQMAAEYYLKLGTENNIPNADLMAILMFLQANDLTKAKRTLQQLEKAKKKILAKELSDSVIITLCNDLINGKVIEIDSKIQKGLIEVDKDVQNEITRTIKYLTLHQKAPKSSKK